MAKLAFEHCADDYARYRPAYPPEVLAFVDQTAPRGAIADVGAGTGIFTRALAETGRTVIAIDPSPAMLAQIAPADHGTLIPRIVAPAEQLPLDDASVAGVTCAQSFHWFNPPVALAEFARVLPPGGLLLLVWNNRDVSDPFVAEFEQLVTRFNPKYCCEYRQQDWAGKIAATGLFTPVETVRYRSLWTMPTSAFVGFTRSASYIRNVLSASDRAAFERALDEILARHTDNGRCTVPLNTVGWWCRRR